MRLHTSLYYPAVRAALEQAKNDGHVAGDVVFASNTAEHGSRSHPRAFEIQLGTWDQTSLPAGYTDQNGRRMNVRRRSASGGHWGATWHEWGWFLAAVFAADPQAHIGSYDDREDFHFQTHGEFAGFPAQGGTPPQGSIAVDPGGPLTTVVVGQGGRLFTRVTDNHINVIDYGRARYVSYGQVSYGRVPEPLPEPPPAPPADLPPAAVPDRDSCDYCGPIDEPHLQHFGAEHEAPPPPRPAFRPSRYDTSPVW